MNKNIKVIISGVILASSILGSVPVFADNHSNVESNTVIESNKGFKFTEEEKSYLANWLIENGVNENTKDKLMEKLDKGEMWDSISGGNPVKIEKLDEMTEKTIQAEEGFNKVAPIVKDDLIFSRDLLNGSTELLNNVTEKYDKEALLKALQSVNNKLTAADNSLKSTINVYRNTKNKNILEMMLWIS